MCNTFDNPRRFQLTILFKVSLFITKIEGMKKEQDVLYIENKSRERERNYWQDAVRARSRAQHGKRAFGCVPNRILNE